MPQAWRTSPGERARAKARGAHGQLPFLQDETSGAVAARDSRCEAKMTKTRGPMDEMAKSPTTLVQSSIEMTAILSRRRQIRPSARARRQPPQVRDGTHTSATMTQLRNRSTRNASAKLSVRKRARMALAVVENEWGGPESDSDPRVSRRSWVQWRRRIATVVPGRGRWWGRSVSERALRPRMTWRERTHLGGGSSGRAGRRAGWPTQCRACRPRRRNRRQRDGRCPCS